MVFRNVPEEETLARATFPNWYDNQTTSVLVRSAGERSPILLKESGAMASGSALPAGYLHPSALEAALGGERLPPRGAVRQQALSV